MYYWITVEIEDIFDSAKCVLLCFQADKTFEECGAWCNENEKCKGFAVVDKKTRPDAKSCYLKDSLKYPGRASKGVVIYYKLQEGWKPKILFYLLLVPVLAISFLFDKKSFIHLYLNSLILMSHFYFYFSLSLTKSKLYSIYRVAICLKFLCSVLKRKIALMNKVEISNKYQLTNIIFNYRSASGY